jgi:L-fuculose-phosphate aldolase
VVIDIDGNQIEGSKKATSERFTHCQIYKKRADIKCIVHAHPVYTVLMTVLGLKPFDNVFISEAAMFLKKVSMAKFAKPSTIEGAQAVSEILYRQRCNNYRQTREFYIRKGSGNRIHTS